MNRKILLLLLLIFCSSIYSQEWKRARLDSLYNLYVRIHSYNGQNIQQNPQADTLKIKCGFGISAEIFIHFNEFTESQQKVLKALYSRPVTETSIVSPSGFFRIHYNINTPPVPHYDIYEFAKALDSSYNFEVNYLGYPPPPSDAYGGLPLDSVGGDGLYDVYIVYLSGVYGETDFETEIGIGTDKYTSYMQVHNNFDSTFYTQGINAARVTVAHEFHHSIQIGNYIYRESDNFFYELTSTSMEEFVFNSVNDYYGYLPDYFNYPYRAFASNDGYNLAIWNIFMKDNFGYDIIKRQWELMPDKRAIDAINSSLLDEQSSFGEELNTFGIWNYFTGYRAKPDTFYSEASNYPLVNTHAFELNIPLNFTSIKATSNNYLLVVNPANRDTLAIILTNTDYKSGIDTLYKNFSASYSIYNYSSPGSNRLDSSNYYEQLSVNNSSLWLTSVILNGNLIKQDTTYYPPVASKLNYVYPNPFRYNSGSGSNIYIYVKTPAYNEVKLYIYSSSMDLVYNKILQVRSGKDNNPVINWNLDDVGKKLSSGVYIYVVKSDKEETIGKLVIFNE